MQRFTILVPAFVFVLAVGLAGCDTDSEQTVVVPPVRPTVAPTATPTSAPTGGPSSTPTPPATATPTRTATPRAPSPSPTPGGAPLPSGSVAAADGNNRVLIFEPPFSNGMNASVVIGQANFTTGGNGLSQTKLADPRGIGFDAGGNLWVTDDSNSRVLEFKPPFTNGMAASVVIGQPNFTSNGLATTQSSLRFPNGVAIDAGGNLWVIDTQNFRALEFKPPFTNGMDASVVLGQADFTSRVSAVAANRFSGAFGIAADSIGDIWVADGSANRVLEFVPPFSNGMNASLVIGQVNFTSGGPGTSATTFSVSDGIGFDITGALWVGDDDNCRVLRFSPPFTNGMSADIVLGQVNFTSNTCAVGQSALEDGQTAVAADASGRVWVGDDFNRRVLAFASPFSDGMNASFVLGQSNFTSNGSSLTQSGMSGAFGVAVAP